MVRQIAVRHKAWETDHGPYTGPIEIDESYFGGKEKNKTESRKGSPKTIVVGAKDRASNQIQIIRCLRKVRLAKDRVYTGRFISRKSASSTTLVPPSERGWIACGRRSAPVET